MILGTKAARSYMEELAKSQKKKLPKGPIDMGPPPKPIKFSKKDKK